MSQVLRILPQEIPPSIGEEGSRLRERPGEGARPYMPEDDRFDRFKLIGWWDQSRLRSAKVLVAGAGALGNEIVKNLALLGVGRILIADLDRIENSNLSRSILYRAPDNGQSKAACAARAAAEIYPEIKAHSFIGNIVHDLGLGAFRWADVVIGGLDNREARLAINRNCYKVNRPFIDGAIEAIDGSARVFVPDGPCYECTMSAQDWKLLQLRRSCNLLTHAEMQAAKTPTTPTISSIIAGVQCQEAVKLLHGMSTLAGSGWVFNGISGDSYVTQFQRKADCCSHDTLDAIIALDGGASSLAACDVLEVARRELGRDATLELPREILEKLVCPSCEREQHIGASLGKINADLAWCPHCRAEGKAIRRQVVTFHHIRGDEKWASRPLSEIGVPAFDILIARRSGDGRSIGLELCGEAGAVLGNLVSTSDVLELEAT